VTPTSPPVDKVTGGAPARVPAATQAQVASAVHAAKESFERNKLTPYQRYEVLHRAASLVADRREQLLHTIIRETGFTISDAGGEVDRCIQTLLVSGEEAKRVHGEMVPLDGAPGQSHRIGFTIRVPRGVVAAITPFNAPLNTVAHKVAPALAAGNTVVLKPASCTPHTADLFCAILLDAGLPAGHINVVHGGGSDVGRWLTEDRGIAFYTFTGSTAVGQQIRQSIGMRSASLELGSISSTIVCDDADLEWAAPRCVNAAFRKAGQVCTSVQRLYVHESVVDRFTEMMVERVRHAKIGDPFDPATLVGPMIDEREAIRAHEWIVEAVQQGARIAFGGTRDGALLGPTILLNTAKQMRVMCEEIFAPVISIVPFAVLDEAIDEVNDTPYGLAAGVFTADINRALLASRRLQVGSVHINETSSSRVDLMPYGGTKESGIGREGPRYAIQEMTEERLVTISWIQPGGTS
jgi:acyl-CoA reductase-like NAD-dependent aldehyde dehydrogenase